MNKNQEKGDSKDSTFDDNELDVYSLSEDQLWTKSELEEMKKSRRSASPKSDTDTTPSKRASKVKSQETISGTDSKPDFYHGVGPFNDVDLPGVWFFRIPHKVWNRNRRNYKLKDVESHKPIGKIVLAVSRGILEGQPDQ